MTNVLEATSTSIQRTIRISPRARMILFSCAGLVTGLAYVGRHSVWLDEAFSIAFSHAGAPTVWHRFGVEVNMALYHAVLHFWLALGTDASTIRLLSVIFAVATIPVFYGLVARLYDDRRATVACALLVVSPIYVEYAQEARAYSLSMLFATAMSYLLVRAVQTGSWVVWGAYAITAGLSSYVHFFLGLVVLAHAVSLAVSKDRARVGWRTVALSFGAALFVALPALVLAHRQAPTHQPNLPKPSVVDLLSVFTLASGPHFSAPAEILFLFGVVAIVCFIARPWRRRKTLSGWPDAFVLSWFVVPIGVSFVGSFVRPTFEPRYLIVSMPALLIMGAVAASVMRLDGPVAVSVLAVVALSLAVDWIYYHDPLRKEDWRGLAASLATKARPGDGLIVYAPYTRTPLDYYIERQSGKVALTPIYPSAPFSSTSLAAAFTSDLTASTARDLKRSASRRPRVWIVLSHNDGMSKGVQAVVNSVRGRPRLLDQSYVRTQLLLYGPRRLDAPS